MSRRLATSSVRTLPRLQVPLAACHAGRTCSLQLAILDVLQYTEITSPSYRRRPCFSAFPARGRFPEDEDGTICHTSGGMPAVFLRIDTEIVTDDVALARAQGAFDLVNASPARA